MKNSAVEGQRVIKTEILRRSFGLFEALNKLTAIYTASEGIKWYSN